MLTAEENELLTRVGAGTRMSNLLRRYWHPVAGLAEMESRWTLKVQIFGENLAVQNPKGNLRPHRPSLPPSRRLARLWHPTEDGIGCAYHGWRLDVEGRCLEQPNESENHAPAKSSAHRIAVF